MHCATQPGDCQHRLLCSTSIARQAVMPHLLMLQGLKPRRSKRPAASIEAPDEGRRRAPLKVVPSAA
jgi:hypothetical protein